ncbi:MAG TPA: nitrile hydratase subunit beta [Methylomirabilota bacterium]|nr:nitrile hydratase subunit beta [Methylomirabilota bacterium]
MDGVHDLGGMHGFGPVEREVNEPAFHERWEAAVYAIMRASLGTGQYTLDEFRHGVERMDPAHYLRSGYYEHWLDGIARVLIEKGVVSGDELAARTAFFAERPDAPASAAVRVMPATPAPRIKWMAPESERPATKPPRFAVGEIVVTRNIHPTGHTRLPRYARGKHGVIHRQHGTHVFPDSNAHGGGEQPQALYSVRFDARELWGPAAEPNQHVYIDLWEPYLEPGAPRG